METPKIKTEKSEENGYSVVESEDTECGECNNYYNPICGVNGVTYTNLC